MKIERFMHPKRALETAMAAMKLVENATNLIIDLRGNRGGYPGIMEYIMNHYFEGAPLLLSNTIHANGSTFQVWSSDLVAGKLRIGTPLYVLIDKNTASASEFFAYTLQAFDKSVIIGQPSAGGAYNNDYFKLPGDFRISISVAVPYNTITKSNWEGKGVQPDHLTELPFETAIKLIIEQAKQP